MSLGEYICPICGRKVKDGGCIFVHDKDIGAFICGYCKSDKMKMEAKGKSDNIGEYKRRLKEFRDSEGKG